MNTSDLPGDLTGSHPFVSYANKLKRAIARRTPLIGIGYKLREGENGYVQEILPGAGGRPGESGIGTQVQLISVAGDTLIVQGFDNSELTGDAIVIAKPYELRQSIASEVIDGITITYVYENAWTRNAYASGTFLEHQIILPRYTAGGLLQYIDCDHTLLTGITRIDVNVAGRAWARKYQ